MLSPRRFTVWTVTTLALFAWHVPVRAQSPEQQQHDMHMDMPPPSGWQFMQDGLLRLVGNRQGGPRGGTEVVAPNWWMGMASRRAGRSQVTFTGMFSLDPLTVGNAGMRELFQAGEAFNGRPLVDRQHPHDVFMQIAASWRIQVGDRTSFTLAGGPAGEPALGPIAFMHRPSAASLPLAPLSHHTFDSTHISYGVIAGGFERGPITVEASVFNGREPDQHRWDFDFGPLDSVSARAWFRPAKEWQLQVSTGRLVQPEELEPGNVQRTTLSASWFRATDDLFSAVAFGYGVNAKTRGHRQALFAEATRSAARFVLSGRVEVLQVETDVLLNDLAPPAGIAAPVSTVGVFTAALSRRLTAWHGMDLAAGGALTLYAVPGLLQQSYGRSPVSLQVFVEIRPPAGMGRMWNMRMTNPPVGPNMAMPMATGGSGSRQPARR